VFNSNKEADVFLEELGSVKEDVCVCDQTTLDKKDMQFTQIPFSQYAKEWFYGDHSHEVTPQTFKLRKVVLDKHIAPYFGDLYLHKITEQEIAELFAQKDREGYSKSTIGNVHNFLSTLFRSAVKKGYLDKNPIRFMNMIKAPNRIPVILSESEIEKLLEAAYSEGEGMLYEFEISTGLRLAEILALSWSDIDFDHKKKIVGPNSSGNPNIVKMRSGN
jgi:integrase